jgi:hypothetical protein
LSIQIHRIAWRTCRKSELLIECQPRETLDTQP